MLKQFHLKYLFLSFVIILSIIFCYQKYQKELTFFENHPRIEIHQQYNFLANIKSVKNGKIKDVSYNINNLNIHKLGTYTINYHYHHRQYPLKVDVIDSKKPSFQIHPYEIDLGMQAYPKNFISHIQDQTQTKIYFDKKYRFNKLGKQKISITVEDQAHNKTTKNTYLKICKADKQKPIIKNLQPLTLKINTPYDLKEGLVYHDNQDPHPQLIINSNQFDISKEGTYYVSYIVKDRSGNQTKKTRKITVVKNIKIGVEQESHEKIVYLTFDDGPSSNTIKILRILDQYKIKATFFVTGNGQNYNKYIKLAQEKGHTIGMHSYSHDYDKIYKSVDDYMADLERLSQMLNNLIGYTPHYIRFPGGSSNQISKQYNIGIMSALTKRVIDEGYQYYDWNCGTGDATAHLVSVNKIIQSATHSSHNNIIILAHDTNTKTTTVEALPTIIQYYLNKGYKFKAIDDYSFTCHHHVKN